MLRTVEGIYIRTHLLQKDTIGIGADHLYVFKFESSPDLGFQDIRYAGAISKSGIFFLRFVRFNRIVLPASECENRRERDCCKTVQKCFEFHIHISAIKFSERNLHRERDGS